MKVIFLGTPTFALNVLKSIHKSHHEVVAVVCQPSKQVGRGAKVVEPPTKVYANEFSIPVYQFEKISRDGVDELKALNADVMVTAAYGQILSQEVLNITPNGVFNVHASLLPKYRGSSPIQWALINGENTTGVTIMKTNVGVDDGDILLQEECVIQEDDSEETMFEKLSDIGAKLIVEALDMIENKNVNLVRQGDNFTHFPMLTKEMAHIDFSKKAQEITNLVRGIVSWPTAYFELGQDKFKVFKTKPHIGQNLGPCGQVVISDNKRGLFVSCADGMIEIVELQAPNSKRMTAKAFLNGRKIDVGEKLI